MSEFELWVLVGVCVGLTAGMGLSAYVRGVRKRHAEEATLLDQLKQLLEGEREDDPVSKR